MRECGLEDRRAETGREDIRVKDGEDGVEDDEDGRSDRVRSVVLVSLFLTYREGIE